jgi:N-methylhydantoinase A/oxoprolinase/acetone carboxylase beta subunit
MAKSPDRPMNSIDIDVGGTFTDLVLTLDGERTIAKCPTTPHDLSICFMNAVEEGAQICGLAMSELMPRIDIVRYSTTVALNRLIQRQGPRVGLMMTEGHEDAILIGRGAQWVDGKRVTERRNLAVQRKPLPLIERRMIVGIRERIDSAGSIIRPLDEDDVRLKLRRLIDRGARAIVVSLLWSFMKPDHEHRVKEIIREEYKEYHIGYLPVVLSSQVVAKLGEYERTMTAVLDAYLQHAMQTELSATWDKMRDQGYRGSFLMIHNSGGSGEIFKTPASRTFNGGPVAGSWALPISPRFWATRTLSRQIWAVPASTSVSWSNLACETTNSGRSSTPGWSASPCYKPSRSAPEEDR